MIFENIETPKSNFAIYKKMPRKAYHVFAILDILIFDILDNSSRFIQNRKYQNVKKK